STLRKTWMLAGAKTNSSNSVLPPRFFATQLRLKLALYLLIIEHLPVTNVANRLGFYDVAAFRRQFYNRYKNNPSKTEAFVNI
ncbi:MAG TPA: helix-turn-helix domain-containing protein, partial [Niabella sp.]|nr:helix-turn-helix domain-containing protein [Niabella sp.]